VSGWMFMFIGILAGFFGGLWAGAVADSLERRNGRMVEQCPNCGSMLTEKVEEKERSWRHVVYVYECLECQDRFVVAKSIRKGRET